MSASCLHAVQYVPIWRPASLPTLGHNKAMHRHFVCLLPTCCKLGPAMLLDWPVTALAAFVMLTCSPQPARVAIVSVLVFDTRALAAD